MRVTPNQIIKNMQFLLNDRFYDMSKLQEQIASGKRLQRPSDGPMDTANAVKATTALAEFASYKLNIEDSTSYMQVTDTAINSMNNLLHRMRELAIGASTDTITTSERVYFNKEVEQLLRQIVSLINTQYKTDYIFNGTETKIPPLEMRSSVANTAQDYADLKMAYFDASAGPLPATVQIFEGFSGDPVTNIIPGSLVLKNGGTTYTENTDYTIDYVTGQITVISPALGVDLTPGSPNYALGVFSLSFDYLAKGEDIYGSTVSNQGKIMREIEKGITTQINITGDEIMNDPVTGANMFGTIIGLGQDLLQNDTTGIGNAITRIDTVFKAVIAAQGKNGARVNKIESTLDRNALQTINATEVKSNLQDTEMASAITNYMNMQNVYNAALKSSANVMQQSLVNFL